MENNNGNGGPGLFTGMGGMGGLGGGQPNLQGLSPYLNIDPAYLNSNQPEFIFDQEAKRGGMEKSFTAIGSSVILGAAAGGAYGLYDGVRATAMSDMKGKLRRTQIMNYTLKSGASVSNSLGSIAVIYSSLYCLISLAHEEDDEMKSMVTGAVSGALFKSSAGLKKCLTGGAVGLGLATLWAFGLKRQEEIQNYI